MSWVPAFCFNRRSGIGPPDDWADVDQAVHSMKSLDAIIFCSHNGVEFFLDRLLELGFDTRRLPATIACVGNQTAGALQEYHLRTDIVPETFRAESVAEVLSETAAGKKMLVIRASRGRDTLTQRLTDAGAEATEVVAYSHTDVPQADPDIVAAAANSSIDWVTLTSSASAESIAKLLGPALGNMKIASLGPVTSETIRRLGYDVSVEANPYTVRSMVDAIVDCESSTT